MPVHGELDFDHNIFQPGQRHLADDKLFVRFFEDILPDEEASKVKARPIFRDVTMVTIMVPGNRRTIITREARQEDMARFAKQFDHYKRGETGIPGTPIKEWGMCARSFAEELKYQGFHTVEQLANAQEQAFQKLPGLRELSDRAKAYLAAAEGVAPQAKLQAELTARDEQIEALKKSLEEQARAIAELKKGK